MRWVAARRAGQCCGKVSPLWDSMVGGQAVGGGCVGGRVVRAVESSRGQVGGAGGGVTDGNPSPRYYVNTEDMILSPPTVVRGAPLAWEAAVTAAPARTSAGLAGG